MFSRRLLDERSVAKQGTAASLSCTHRRLEGKEHHCILAFILEQRAESILHAFIPVPMLYEYVFMSEAIKEVFHETP